MSEQPPKRPFNFDLPDATPPPAAPRQPFQFPVEEGLDYNELRTGPAVEPIETVAPQRRTALRWLLGLGLLLLVLLIGLDAYQLLVVQFERSLLWGGLLSAVMAAVVVALLVVIGREWRAYHRLQQVGRLRAQALRARTGGDADQALGLVEEFARLYHGRPRMRARIEQFQQGQAGHHSAEETLDRFTRQVIKPMDGQAYALINRYAVDTAIVTAISPFASLDALLSLWRNTRMVRAIAEHYGLRPGLTGGLLLLKYVLQNLATAGASHYVSDALAESMGSDLLGKLSQRLSQGVINGLMTVRLGLMAVEQCRPLPFQPEDKHSFRQLFRNVRRRHEQYVEAAPDADNRPR